MLPWCVRKGGRNSKYYFLSKCFIPIFSFYNELFFLTTLNNFVGLQYRSVWKQCCKGSWCSLKFVCSYPMFTHTYTNTLTKLDFKQYFNHKKRRRHRYYPTFQCNLCVMCSRVKQSPSNKDLRWALFMKTDFSTSISALTRMWFHLLPYGFVSSSL